MLGYLPSLYPCNGRRHPALQLPFSRLYEDAPMAVGSVGGPTPAAPAAPATSEAAPAEAAAAASAPVEVAPGQVGRLRVDIGWKFWAKRTVPEDEIEGAAVEWAIKFYDAQVGAGVGARAGDGGGSHALATCMCGFGCRMVYRWAQQLLVWVRWGGVREFQK